MNDDPRVLKPLSFEYLVPEFARPDFKLPEEPIEKGNEKVNVDTKGVGQDPSTARGEWMSPLLRELLEKKGNKTMDEELFQRVEVDIEKFTRAAMELQVAVIDAEAQLEIARLRLVDVEDTLEKARGQLRHHLDSVRGMKVAMPAHPDWGQNVYKAGERDA